MKKRFASRADEALQQRKAGVANAAKRRLGMGAAQPGGKISGGGMSPATNFAANSTGKFIPRTATGRPASSPGVSGRAVGDGAGVPDVMRQKGALKKFGTKPGVKTAPGLNKKF